MNRINGKSFQVRMMGFRIRFENFSITIEDESGVAMDGGVPNGNLPGATKASVEAELDSYNFGLVSAAAKAAGSWQKLPTFPLDAYASGANSQGPEVLHVRAHDCKLRVSDLLTIDPNSSDKTTHKVKMDVTGSDFVWINGTPYLDASDFSLI